MTKIPQIGCFNCIHPAVIYLQSDPEGLGAMGVRDVSWQAAKISAHIK